MFKFILFYFIVVRVKNRHKFITKLNVLKNHFKGIGQNILYLFKYLYFLLDLNICSIIFKNIFNG